MIRSSALLGLALAAPCLALASPAMVAPEERTGSGFVSASGALVLENTDVHATVQLGLAVVDVRQTFHNPHTEPIDATYVFPLPVEAAVRSMRMTCGERVIEAEIAEREAARAAYEKARQQGKRAALLEQQRANLFTQRVAGLCPGETVEVALQYVEPVARQDGRESLVFPTTTGVRYEPADLDEPALTRAEQTPHRLTWRVDILERLPVESVWSDTHAVTVADEGDWGAEITFASVAQIPDSDVHLSWTMAGDTARTAAVAAAPLPDEDAGYVAVSIEPALVEDLPPPRNRELFFVMDSSCSMSGVPWETSVAAVKASLDEMRPDDTFNLVKFSGGSDSLFDTPQPATTENIAEARAWMGSFVGGGTRMDQGLIHALSQPGDPEALRLVLLATDGYIGDERGLFRVVDQHRADNTRVFGLGVGSSVNRLLLDGLAEIGRGAVQYQLPDTPIEETVARFHERIARPALTDVSIDWGALEVHDQYPRQLPDLWAGQPLRVVARHDTVPSDGESVVTISGRVGDEWFDLHVPVDLSVAGAHEGVRSLWARRRIAWLERPGLSQEQVDDRDGEILETALRHHLVSRVTSLVAVDDDPSPCGRAEHAVDVPLVLPAQTAGARGGVAANAGVLGALGGTGAGYGTGGLGARGSGFGGGGTAMGIAGLGSKGLGSGKSGLIGAKGAARVKGEGSLVAVGHPIVLGSLDRSLIEEVIERHRNQIRYCYQRELQKTPGLQGKVVVKFTIHEDGSVSAASIKSSTVGSEALEQCVTGRVLRMSFPEPKGGGIVIVSYPFEFAPTSSDAD